MAVQQIIKPSVVNSPFRSLQIHRQNSDEAKSPLAKRIPWYCLHIWLLLETVSPLRDGATTGVSPKRQAKQVEHRH